MYINQSEILDATNGGLDIILSYYPQARDCVDRSAKNFKIRSERTASATLKKLKDGHWIVTDFGSDSTSRNGIQVCEYEESISYREALAILADRYNIAGVKKSRFKSDFNKRPATTEEEEGAYYFDIKDEIEEWELKELGPKVKKETCKKYHVFSLKSFTQIKNRHALVTSSNENYPIFLFDHGDWTKIYQPRNQDKQFRFRYTGTKPKDWINGLAQVKIAYEDHLSQSQEKDDFDPENEAHTKLPEVILCSGDRDALNVAGMGYQVIWLNSETAALSKSQYKEIIRCTQILYNLPDIDSTGIKQAIKLGLKYIDIRTIRLPEKLKEYRDMRGHPRKDIKDFLEIWPDPTNFKNLLRVALPTKFWDEVLKDNRLSYQFNNVQAYYFLWANGFMTLEDKNSKEGYSLIRIQENKVKIITPREARVFMAKFLEERYFPIPLRNMVFRNTQLTEASLGNLSEAIVDFTDFDKKSQFFFFKNKTWMVTADKIHEYRPEEIQRYVWDEEVIDHKVKKLDAPFEITYDSETKTYDIEISDYSSMFLRFLINTSRIHWQQEIEVRLRKKDEEYQLNYWKKNHWRLDGELLTDEEIWEHKQHLINKIFSIGYLMHRQKDPARPWCVFAMDNKIDESGKSNGRSGKSVCYKFMREFMKSVTLAGRNPKLIDNNHIYDRVTEHIDYVLIDDADQYLKFGFFFDATTGELNVNPKNNQSYEIPFAKSPKFCITSNFTLTNIDPSTEGRILYTVFSDYYHYKTEDSTYRETKTINDDFGKNLFLDYTEEEWNYDINFIAECTRFFMQVPSPGKIHPPMDVVTLRNLRTQMSEGFKDWADVFFSQDGDNVDVLVDKDKAYEDYKQKSGSGRVTKNKFSSRLKAWASYTEYVAALDPSDMKGKYGRIIRKNNEGKAAEWIYVQTKEINPIDLVDSDLSEKNMPF